MNNRTSNNLLPIVKENVFTLAPDEDDDFKTRIYSDCFKSYQVSDFYELGFILNKVKHNIWFGQGLFHTNTVEGQKMGNILKIILIIGYVQRYFSVNVK